MLHVQRTRRAQANANKTGKQCSNKVKEKLGVKIPRNMKEALLFDRENKNNKWMDAMAKEMDGLKRLKCFKLHPPTKTFTKADD